MMRVNLVKLIRGCTYQQTIYSPQQGIVDVYALSCGEKHECESYDGHKDVANQKGEGGRVQPRVCCMGDLEGSSDDKHLHDNAGGYQH